MAAQQEWVRVHSTPRGTKVGVTLRKGNVIVKVETKAYEHTIGSEVDYCRAEAWRRMAKLEKLPWVDS